MKFLPLFLFLILSGTSAKALTTNEDTCAPQIIDHVNHVLGGGYTHYKGLPSEHKILATDLTKTDLATLLQTKTWRNGIFKQYLDAVEGAKNLRIYTISGDDLFIVVAHEDPATGTCIKLFSIFDWAE